MMKRINAHIVFPWLGVLVIALLGFSPPTSAQQSQQEQMLTPQKGAQGPYKTGNGRLAGQAWGTEDGCAKAAVQAFPDHDAASNARRDRAKRDCMMKNGVRFGEAPGSPTR
jgi:hypothetical protein